MKGNIHKALSRAWEKWRAVYDEARCHKVKLQDEDYVLSHVDEIRARIYKDLHWHPALHVKMPKRFAAVGASQNNRGGLHIEDLATFTKFKETSRGPTDASAWIIRKRLLFGAYPEGMARIDRTKTTDRKTTQCSCRRQDFCLCLPYDSRGDKGAETRLQERS